MFQGRYGNDRLNMALSVAGAVLLVVSMFFGRQSAASTALMLLSLVAFGLTLARMFSKNFQARTAENLRYLALRAKITGWWSNLRTGVHRARTTHKNPTFAERRKFKYFVCPQCMQRLRVPRGKGKLRVTCTRCGNKFEIKS